MQLKPLLLAALAYTVGTFFWAVLWHVLLLEEVYTTFGYFEGEPSFVLGFVTILIQGLVLSLLYPLVQLSGNPLLRGLKYALFVGIFFWTSHVLAFIAKQQVAQATLFLLLETGYLVVQFGLFGLLVGLIYAKFGGEASSKL